MEIFIGLLFAVLGIIMEMVSGIVEGTETTAAHTARCPEIYPEQIITIK